MADHAALIRIRDGARFHSHHVGKCLVDFRRQDRDIARSDVHQREIQRETILRVADKTLVVGSPRHISE